MKFTSTSIIVFGEKHKLRFSEIVSFTAPCGIVVEIVNHDKDDDTVVVKMMFESDNLETAKFQTEKELLRLVDLLSWKHNIVVTKYRTTGVQHSETIGRTHTLILAETLHVTTSLSTLTTIGAEGVQQLKLILEKEYSEGAEGVLLKWRDAIRQESAIARFLLYYQVLEALFTNEQFAPKRHYLQCFKHCFYRIFKNQVREHVFAPSTRPKKVTVRQMVDKWIRKTDPNVPLRMTGKNSNEEVSIYTYLRDCVHAKPENKQFPFSEFKQNVNNLQTLVRRGVEEKFPELGEII